MNVDSTTSLSQTYEDRPVRWFLFAAGFWAVIAAVATVVLSLLLVMPKLFYELGDSAQHFSFGRLFPTQMQVLVYGLLGNGFFAFTYFAAQRLCRRRLALVPLSGLHFLSWQGLIVAAILAGSQLQTQGRWLGWMPWSLDIALVATWLLLFMPSLVITLSHREHATRLAPPIWFVLAIAIAVPLLHVVNNLASSEGTIYFGVQDAMIQWWSGRGLASYWMTVPAVAMLYFLVPMVGSGVIHSHRLTVIHFWSIALFGCWGGNFQWHLTAVPEWADSLAMFAGLMLWLGCFGGAYNLWRSLPRNGGRVERSVAQRLVTAAVVCYLIYCVDSGYMSLKQSSSSTQFTDWATANQMLAILGVSGLSLVAFSLLIMPAISAASTNIRRGNWLRWLAVEGAAFQVIALYVAGRTQAFSWNQLNDLGRLEYPEFVNAIAWVEPMWIVVAFGASAWLLAMLAWLTLLLKMVSSTNGLPATIPKGASSESTDPITVPSRLVDAPVLGVAIGLEQWTQLTWHAAIERSIGKLATRIGAGLAIGTLLFWLPSFLVRGLNGNASSVTQSPYTELELIGREIYVREGCVSCHTQATRPLVPEVLRYGSFSQATDYAFDRPTQIGFRRVGPDLAREGGRQTSLWHWQHLENPQSMTPESVMPAFDYLLSKPLEFGKSEAIVRQAELVAADIVSQGGPVIHDDNLLMNSSGVALIAYLQRLGMVTTSSPPMENN